MRARSRAVVAALALVCCLAATAFAQQGERAGSVAELQGRAEVQRAGESTWAPLAVGDPILVGDQLRTLDDGKMRIVLREDSALTLGPGSQLGITEQLLAPATVSRFQLLLGTIKAAVTERYAEPQAKFEVETPTAIAGVRGTSFIAEYDPGAEETLVVGVEDVTRVRGRDDPTGRGEVELGPGSATRVRRGSRPLAPMVLPESRFRSLQGVTQLTGPGAGAGIRQRANQLDARRPQRGGQRAYSAEERGVDQPLFRPRGPKPPPPPPPVPPGR